MATDRHGEAGFTLVELLVALLLFALLSVALFAALRLGADTMDRIAGRQDATDQTASAQQLLTRLLTASYPEYVAMPGLHGQIAFDGEPASLSFLAPAPRTVAPGGFAVMRLAVIAAGDTRALRLSARPELAWPDAGDTTVETLLAGASAARFAYWGPDQPDAGSSWHDQWKERPVLPALIRITVAFPPGDPRDWPALIVAPKIAADQACQFVPLTQSCLGR